MAFQLRLDDRRPKAIVCPTALKTDKERRRRSAAISRKLRMLRAHGLIRKRPRSHRYDVSPNGRLILNAILSAHTLTVRQITTCAA